MPRLWALANRKRVATSWVKPLRAFLAGDDTPLTSVCWDDTPPVQRRRQQQLGESQQLQVETMKSDDDDPRDVVRAGVPVSANRSQYYVSRMS